ncbi:MAG: CPBP family glutamic-type intramembrane protease [Devosia sp.]
MCGDNLDAATSRIPFQPRDAVSRSATSAVEISCALFGSLHWADGLWYSMLTGSGLFAGLLVWRRNVAAACGAHPTLDFAEFL